jgi:LEA14-like dessication related protein
MNALINHTRHFSKLITIALSAFLCTSCFDYEDIEFKKMESFEILEREDTHLKIQLMMRINNPNTYSVTLKKSDFDIYLNDKYVGKSTTSQKVKIIKKKEGVYPVVLSIKGKDVLKTALSNMGSLLSGNIKLAAKGNITAKVYGISKTVPIEFSDTFNFREMKK